MIHEDHRHHDHQGRRVQDRRREHPDGHHHQNHHQGHRHRGVNRHRRDDRQRWRRDGHHQGEGQNQGVRPVRLVEHQDDHRVVAEWGDQLKTLVDERQHQGVVESDVQWKTLGAAVR